MDDIKEVKKTVFRIAEKEFVMMGKFVFIDELPENSEKVIVQKASLVQMLTLVVTLGWEEELKEFLPAPLTVIYSRLMEGLSALKNKN